MIVEFQTNKGKFAFVKLPDNIRYNLGISTENILFGDTNDSNNWQYFQINILRSAVIVKFVKDLTEEQWSEVVNKSENKNYDTDDYMWEDYTDIIGWRGFKTATESGKSLMDSLEVYLENPHVQEDRWKGYATERVLKAQERVGNWLLIKYT